MSTPLCHTSRQLLTHLETDRRSSRVRRAGPRHAALRSSRADYPRHCTSHRTVNPFCHCCVVINSGCLEGEERKREGGPQDGVVFAPFGVPVEHQHPPFLRQHPLVPLPSKSQNLWADPVAKIFNFFQPCFRAELPRQRPARLGGRRVSRAAPGTPRFPDPPRLKSTAQRSTCHNTPGEVKMDLGGRGPEPQWEHRKKKTRGTFAQ